MSRGKSHNPLYGPRKAHGRRCQDAEEAKRVLWQAMEHQFEGGEEQEMCSRCGALAPDAEKAHIGCEAPAEGNDQAYLGFALTPVEQALGTTLAEKASALANTWTPTGEFEERLATWNAEIEARALAGAKLQRPRP